MAPTDFTLTDQDGQPFVFDAERRARSNLLLFFYRGYW